MIKIIEIIIKKKKKKFDSDDGDSEVIYKLLLKDEINGNNKISVRHQDGSFKVEIKEEKKEIKKSDNDNDDDYDLIYIDK